MTPTPPKIRPSLRDLWLVDLGDPVGHEQSGRRPVLVVSVDQLNHGPGGVTVVVPLTTRNRQLPNHVEVEAEGTGLDRISWARCEDVRSISNERLLHRLGSVPELTMLSVIRVLRYLLNA